MQIYCYTSWGPKSKISVLSVRRSFWMYHHTFFLKDSTCLQLSQLISLISSCRMFGSLIVSFESILSLPWSLQAESASAGIASSVICGSSVCVSGAHSIRWGGLHDLDSLLCWDAWGDPWVPCLLSSESYLCVWTLTFSSFERSLERVIQPNFWLFLQRVLSRQWFSSLLHLLPSG